MVNDTFKYQEKFVGRQQKATVLDRQLMSQ